MNLKSLCTILVTVTTQPPLGNYCPRKKKKMDGNGNGDGEMGAEYKSHLLYIVVLCFGEKGFSFCCHLRRKRASPLRPSSVPEGVREKKDQGFSRCRACGEGERGVTLESRSLEGLYCLFINIYLPTWMIESNEREREKKVLDLHK